MITASQGKAKAVGRPRYTHSLNALAYVLLAAGAAFMLFPFVWMVSTSLKLPKDVFSLNVIPQSFTLQNYTKVFTETPFLDWLTNSFLIAAITTLSVCFFDSIIGYVLASFSFVGKRLIFITILSTLMVPTEMLIIPWYIGSVKLGWVDTYWGVLFPGLISAFGIFLMKQFMESLPKELFDAARIDGMGEWGIMLRIALPLVKPALATLCILTFLGNWNAFLWPLIITQTPEQLTVPVGLAFFSSELKDSSSWVLIMTGAAISVTPLLVVFLIFQKQIIRGIAMTGFK